MDDLKIHFSRYGNLLVWGAIALLGTAALLLFAEFFGAVKEFTFIGQGIQFQNTITVSGKGEITMIPDTAEFSFAVVAEAKTVQDAQKEVTNTMNAILKFLDDFGVDKKDVKTTNYSITPRYEYRVVESEGGIKSQSYYPIPRNPVLIGYEVSHSVSVKVKNKEKVGEIVSEIGSRGATNVGDIQFTFEDEDKIIEKARRVAIDDAREKASVLAGDLGVSLGKIISFSDSGGGFPIYYRGVEAVKFDAGGGAPPIPEIPSGENTVTSYVTIVYVID